MLSPEYAAGFFDGEGCVNITMAGEIRQAVLRVTIVNTDPNILNEFSKTFDGKLLRPRAYSNPNWKLFRAVEWRGKRAVAFLKVIHPHVIVKRKQVDLAFKFWEFMHLPILERCVVVHSPSEKAPWHTHLARSKRTLTRELSFKERLSRLNAKGRAA